ncbi:MAG TPA: hypothetical protein VLH10_27735, partial [Yinghuangia sp.]|nr:hypothetical protein [Yinghuangia sp.]
CCARERPARPGRRRLRRCDTERQDLMTAPPRPRTAAISPAVAAAVGRRTDPEVDHPRIAAVLEHLRSTGRVLVSLHDVRATQRRLMGTADTTEWIEAALAAFAAVGERIVETGVHNGDRDAALRWRLVTAEPGEVERRRDAEITRLCDDAVGNLRAADQKASFLMTGVLFLLGGVTQLGARPVAFAVGGLLAAAALLFAGVLYPRLAGFRTWANNTPPGVVLVDLAPALAPMGRVAELARLRGTAAAKYRLIQAGIAVVVAALGVLGVHFAAGL